MGRKIRNLILFYKIGVSHHHKQLSANSTSALAQCVRYDRLILIMFFVDAVTSLIKYKLSQSGTRKVERLCPLFQNLLRILFFQSNTRKSFKTY